MVAPPPERHEAPRKASSTQQRTPDLLRSAAKLGETPRAKEEGRKRGRKHADGAARPSLAAEGSPPEGERPATGITPDALRSGRACLPMNYLLSNRPLGSEYGFAQDVSCRAEGTNWSRLRRPEVSSWKAMVVWPACRGP